MANLIPHVKKNIFLRKNQLKHIDKSQHNTFSKFQIIVDIFLTFKNIVIIPSCVK